MSAQKGSPNWYWQQLGYTITRDKSTGVTHRTITDAAGEVAYTGYPCDIEKESRAARAHFWYKNAGETGKHKSTKPRGAKSGLQLLIKENTRAE